MWFLTGIAIAMDVFGNRFVMRKCAGHKRDLLRGNV